MENKKVLIVDDDTVFLEEARDMLSAKGYSAFVADNHVDALEIARTVNPDVVLIDIKLNGINGFQLANKFREMEAISHIPIIAITGHFIDDEHFLSPDIFNMDTCLRKPFDAETLTDYIGAVSKKEELVW